MSNDHELYPLKDHHKSDNGYKKCDIAKVKMIKCSHELKPKSFKLRNDLCHRHINLFVSSNSFRNLQVVLQSILVSTIVP